MQIILNTDAHIDGSAELTRQIEATVKTALGRYRDRITRVEVHLADDNSPHKSAGNDKRCLIEVRLAGIPPIAVSHRGPSLGQAVDGAAERLEKTVQRTLGRKDALFKRRARARADFTAVDPLLQRDVTTGKQEEFLTLLSPLLDHLRDHARRELRILEINGLLPSGQLTAGELLNEVIARAWLQLEGRLPQIPLDLWLVNALDQTLDDMIKLEPKKEMSLDQRSDAALSADAPQVDDQEWWVWLLGEDEANALSDTIPSGENASAAEQLAVEELKDRIHRLLGSLPRTRRQAFVLNVLDGYELFEIAMLQDRPEEEVQADIESARNTLREQLPAGSRSQASSGHAAPATSRPK